MQMLEGELVWAAVCDVNVLISGEHGAGKKAAAFRLHRDGRRSQRPFVAVHPRELLESTTYLADRLSETAADGTVLLDHPEGIPAGRQSELLQFIERGDAGALAANGQSVRFLTVTGHDLFDRVTTKEFSEALFYRLNTIHLVIPPLRERREDVPVLLNHFLTAYGCPPMPQLSDDAWHQLVSYQWPGNIQELRATAAMIAAQHLERPLEPRDLPAYLLQTT